MIYASSTASSSVLSLAAVVAGFCVARGATPQGPHTPNAVTIIRNVTVVPMDAPRVLRGQTVVLRGSTIEQVAAANDVLLPANAVSIDGRGGYLLPGLADMHVHLSDAGEFPGAPEAELTLLLASGVTTARCMKGLPSHLALRGRVERGDVLGPTLIVAGPGLDGQAVPTTAVAEKLVPEQAAAGYDLLKILPGLKRPVYDAIAGAAQKAAIPFAGHVPADVGLLHALDMGQQTIEHLDGYVELLGVSKPVSTEKLRELVHHTIESGAWNVPTMAVMEANLGLIDASALMSRPELEYVPEAFIKQWVKIRGYGNPPQSVSEEIQRRRMMVLKALSDANSRILLGTDSPQLFNIPGFSVRREMQLMAASGMKPFDVLRAATVASGEYTKRACGMIKPGQCADLILLKENPLENLSALEHLSGVVAHGRWVGSSEIRAHLQAVRDRPGNYRLPATP